MESEIFPSFGSYIYIMLKPLRNRLVAMSRSHLYSNQFAEVLGLFTLAEDENEHEGTR